jgi:putative SOS response-associated peptidase YedK
MCNLVSIGRNRKSRRGVPGKWTPPEQLELPLYYVAFAFDFPLLPVLRADGEWELARWGLVPYWTRTEEKAKQIRTSAVNARSESMWTKPAFEEAARNGRCLILVDGFFEFHHHAGVAYPFHVYLEGNPDFFMAGLRDTWINPANGKKEVTCSIVTTAANSFMREIHNKLPQPEERRMPVVVPADWAEAWLSSATPMEVLLRIVSTREIPEMRAHPVARTLNGPKTRANKPTAQEPVDYAELTDVMNLIRPKG